MHSSQIHTLDERVDRRSSRARIQCVLTFLVVFLAWFAAPSISTATAASTNTLFSPSDTPTTFTSGSSPVELGIKFQSDVNGTITGIRFYKGLSDTDVHTGSLWSSTGTLLATGTFLNETASGWQQLNFSIPVAITANTTYIASFHTTAFYYSYSYFQNSGVDNAPLHALQSGVDGTNGVFFYGAGGVFPNQSYLAANYWVDVVFSPSAPTLPPSIGSTIFSAAATPATFSTVSTPIELGVKFRSDVSGMVTGIRFYKVLGDTGVHTGSLWSSTGTLLATGTFSNETASGWQQLNFSTPVAIRAYTTYVASYHTGPFYYSYLFFQNGGVDKAPLHALGDGVDGTNGVFVYGPGGMFPNQSYLASNYWVDVVFSGTAVSASNSPPVVNAGPNQQITLPAAASLSGIVTDDGLPNGILTVLWSVVSGPGTVTFANAAAANTTATFSAAGTYALQLTASDGAVSASSTTTVNVGASAGACGQTVSKTVTLTANVASSIGITGLQFQLDGTNLGPLLTTSPYSFAWDTTAVANGCHVITAAAQDTNGNIGIATVTAAVTNP